MVCSLSRWRLGYPVEKDSGLTRPGHFQLANYRDWLRGIPDEITSTAVILQCPDAPVFPEPARGKKIVGITACYCGTDENAGDQLLRPIRNFGSPLADTFASMPYGDSGRISLDPVEPMSVYGHTEFLTVLFDEMLDRFVELTGAHSDSPLALAEIRQLGGAISRVDPSANAVSHRDAAFLLHLSAPVKEASEVAKLEAFIKEAVDKLKPFETGGAQLNFLGDGDVGDDRTRAAYSSNHYQRLVELKKKYDPENLFRFNHNIRP